MVRSSPWSSINFRRWSEVRAIARLYELARHGPPGCASSGTNSVHGASAGLEWEAFMLYLFQASAFPQRDPCASRFGEEV